MTVVAYSATQLGLNDVQKKAVRKWLRAQDRDVFHHGDCIGGDYDGALIAYGLGWFIEAHPCNIEEKRANAPSNVRHPAFAPLTRNRHIVASADVLLAVPRYPNEQRRSGTWATVRYAREHGIPRFLVMADGTIVKE